MRRTRLADGRELIYFDSGPAQVPPAPDLRVLEPSASAGSMRHDALADEWVVVAGHRQGRTHLPADDACPLCPSAGARLTEVPATAYEVAVFQNRFPSFSPPSPGWRLPDPGHGAEAHAAGRCEVVCFSDDHEASFADLGPERVRLVVDAWAQRTEELSRLPYVALVFPFENRGKEIGVTITHPHGQIYAYPIIPPRAASELRASQRHHDRTGRHLVADVVASEVADGTRVILQTAHWVAFVPYAARWPFQVQLHPTRHVHDMAELREDERDDLARVYPQLLRRMDALFALPMPYVAAWHQAATGPLRRHGRLYLDLFTTRRAPDKLKFLAGSESAMGSFVNDIAPEDAAELLRAAAP